MNISDKESDLRRLKAFSGDPVWTGWLAPLIKERLDLATSRHEDESLSAEKRAEWLHAMKQLRELASAVPARIKALEAALAKEREKVARAGKTF